MRRFRLRSRFCMMGECGWLTWDIRQLQVCGKHERLCKKLCRFYRTCHLCHGGGREWTHGFSEHLFARAESSELPIAHHSHFIDGG